MSDTAVMSMIRELIAGDPWEHSLEGLDDCCHFCGSDTAPWLPEPGGRGDWDRHPRHVHYRRCAWVRAHGLLGEPLPPGHFTIDAKPDWVPVPVWFQREDAIEAEGLL